MKIELIKINKLKPASYNPRQMSSKQYNDLKKSIEKFDLVDPIIINKDYTVIGGHQRLRICKELNYKDVDCVILDLSKEQEKELNIRLNKNTGDFDMDILANEFDIEDLTDWGFKHIDLGLNIDKIKEEQPEIEITEEILEEHNYIVFTFDNTLDWNVAKEMFDIKTVAKAGYTETYMQKGVGRVRKGIELINKVNKK